MPTTIRDLAKQLNLSISTVSYALNDGPRSVPAEVKEKVLRLAKELDYRPNRIARSMVTGRTFTIGVVPSDQFENFILSPFILDCMNGIINECEKLNYDLLLFTRFSANEELKVADSISDGRVDGLIFLAPLLGSKLIEIAHRRGVPLVITHSHHGEQYATYTTNNFDTVSIAVNH
ncbi:MAG: LacI family DNA-binding transcriptional regulator, partial [Armatimonadota bacterium]